MLGFFERTMIVCSILVLVMFLTLEAYVMWVGSPYDTASYVMYNDLFLKYGFFEKIAMGTPELSWIEMYPVGGLLFFYPVCLALGDVFLSTTVTHILAAVLAIAAISVLIYRKTGASVYFFQYFIYFLVFCQYFNFTVGRTTELEIIFLATLFFLTERRERVFLLPLMFFINPTIAFPYALLFAYVSFKEKNTLFIPACLLCLLAIVPFLHSLNYPNIASVLSRYEEGQFTPLFLIPPALLLIFSKNRIFQAFSLIFLILALFSSPISLFGLNLLSNMPFIQNIFPCTWCAFFAFAGIIYLPEKKILLPLFVFLSFLFMFSLSGHAPHTIVNEIFYEMDSSKHVFFVVNEGVVSIDTGMTSLAYLRGYDIDITPMYWFADKRYLSEFSENYHKKTCGVAPFLKEREFDNIAIRDVSQERGAVREYLDSCNASYVELGALPDMYIVKISSFGQ